jgi:cobalt-zinc-cadmium efflux system outer membrane protein
MRKLITRARHAVRLVLVLVLSSACASIDPKPSFDSLAEEVRDRSGLEPAWSRTSAEEDAAEKVAAELLAAPLDDASAARVALLRNRALLAEIEELGIARADYAQATRIANPTLSAFRRTPSSGPGTNVEAELVEDLLDVLIQPARKRLAAVEFEAAKLRLGQSMLDLVAEARISFFEFVAAQETVDRVVLVRDLTRAAAELARRQREAGNLEEREVAMFEVAEAQAAIDLTRARLAEGGARERLNVLLGFSGESTDWTAERHLPALPAEEPEFSAIESRAIDSRLDLAAARFGVELVGRALALKKGTRFFPVGVEVGINREKDLDGVRVRGPQISIALPIFDTGAASIARLEAEQRRGQRQLEQLAIEIRAEVRLTRDEVLGTRALVETYQEVLLPKRRAVLDQTLLHYNMMLLGVYDLLLARREETEAARAAISALRDYWVAKVRLERAAGGRLSGSGTDPAARQEPAPAPEEHQGPAPSSGGER